MAPSSFVVVFPTEHSAGHTRVLARNVKRILDMEKEPYSSVSRDGRLILVDANDPVLASAAVERLFGVERVVIARRTKNEFDRIVKEVAEVGGNLLLGGESFLVKVEGHSRGFLPKDVEMAATSAIIEGKSSQKVVPGTAERYDKMLYAYMTEKYAYVSIFEDMGMGGLPSGVQGRAICCVFDELSAASCIEGMRMGYDVDLVALYKKRVGATKMAKVADRVLPHMLRGTVDLSIYKASPGGAGFLNTAAVAAEIAISEARRRGIKHVILPISRIMFPGEYTDRMVSRVFEAGMVPVQAMPDESRLGVLLDRLNLTFGADRMGKRHNISQVPADLKRHEIISSVVPVTVGPNNVHDILDYLGRPEE